MELFKKFWNTNIIGKIYILIILFIVILATITVITRYKNAETQEVTNLEKNEIAEQNTLVSLDNTTQENITVMEEQTQKTEIVEEVPEQKETKNETKTVTTSSNNSYVENNKEEQTSTEKPQEPVEEKQEDNQTVNPSQDSNKPKEDTSPEAEEPVIQQRVDTYKYNGEMTQKIINIIKSNPSSYMTEYGYEVVEDSSIVELTNQFTFTEQRVINSITMKFGTIRVYARDYYVNDEYVWTECFII